MLNAKLFAALAAAILLFALLTGSNVLSHLNPRNFLAFLQTLLAARNKEGTLVVVTGFYARLFLASVCGCIALAYFAVSRWAQRPPNQAAGLVGLCLVAFGVIARFSWAYVSRNFPLRGDADLGRFLPLTFVYNAFYFGALVSGANLAWAAVREGVRRI
jgi:hypothetical protein